MPATAALAARGERGRLRALYLRSTRYLLVSYGGVVIMLVGFGAPFVRLWMGDGFGASYAVLCLLVLGSLVQSQNVVAHVMLPGMGELGAFMRFMAVYPFVTAPCAITGILAGGLVGLAAGTSVSIAVMETAFLVWIVRSRFALPIARVVARCHVPALKALAPAVAAIACLRAVIAIDSWPVLVSSASVAGAAFLVGAWNFGMTPAERRAVRDRMAARPHVTAVTVPHERPEAAA
jgi:O-antigen/teichoic acid export membrane protein